MGERPCLWSKLKLGFIVENDSDNVQEGVEEAEEQLLKILKLNRLQSLRYLRLECRLRAENRFLQIIIDNKPAIKKVSLQMGQRLMPDDDLKRLASTLTKFEEIEVFFFTDRPEPMGRKILVETLRASSGEDSKLKILTMPGNEKRHRNIIEKARGRGILVNLVLYK